MNSFHKAMMPGPSGVQHLRKPCLVFCSGVTNLVDVGQRSSNILASGLSQTELLHFLKLNPGHSEVRHELLKGPRLLRLFLVVQGYFLAEFARVGAATGARAPGHAAGRCGLGGVGWFCSMSSPDRAH